MKNVQKNIQENAWTDEIVLLPDLPDEKIIQGIFFTYFVADCSFI